MKKDQYFGESEESICKIFNQWPNIALSAMSGVREREREG